MFKKILIILILVSLTISVVSANENITEDIIESEPLDVVDDVSVSDEDMLQSSISVSGKTFDDIEKTINNAKKNDIIKLSGTYTSKGSEIYVDKSITLQGPSASNKAVLDAKGLSGIILTSSDAKLTLKNIIFKNSEDVAIQCYNFAIDNCEFLNCNGRVIDSLDSASPSFSISNSKFEGNTGEFYPAIYLYCSKGTCTISKCTFNNNKATDYSGAIHIEAPKVNIFNSVFSANSAKEFSAVDINANEGNIENNVFINNKAEKDYIPSVGYLSPELILKNNTIKSNAGVYENLQLTFLNNPTYYGEVCKIKFTKDGKPLANKKILIEGKKRNSYIYSIKTNVVTDSNGIASFAFASTTQSMDVGIWDYYVLADSGNVKLFSSNNNVNIAKLPGKAIMNDMSINYGSAKTYPVKLVNKNNNNVAANICLYVTFYKNGFYFKNHRISTNLNGVANVKISDLGAGNYKIIITSDEVSEIMGLSETSAKIKINKAPTNVKAPAVKVKAKKSKNFKVTVKSYNKPLKNIKIKLKVFTGKKSKTYTIKTNKKGIAQYNVKKMKLKKGRHKVQISSGNANYKISAKSKIIIK